MPSYNSETSMPRWAYVLLAALAASIGLASSWITAKFFVLGLERIEPDAMARDLLIATGMLMIATELVAFGMAALLPIQQLRSLRRKLMVCGVLLLAFEATTIYVTQVTLLQTTEAGVTANNTRIQNLQTTIEQRRLAAKSLRDNGALQSASSNAWTRTLGANALRDALKVEQGIDPLATELAQLQSASRPSMINILGNTGMLVYSVARALLISVMGLVMFAAAGALLREGRSKVSTHANQGSGSAGRPQRGASNTAIPTIVYAVPTLAAPTYKSTVYSTGFTATKPAAAGIPAMVGAQPNTAPLTSTPAQVHPATNQSPSRERSGHRPSARAFGRLSALIAEGWCKKIPDTLKGISRNGMMQHA